MEKRTVDNGFRFRLGRYPLWYEPGDAELLGCGRLHQILIPQESLEGPCFSGNQARGYVVKQIGLLPLQRRERPLSQFSKENNGHPLRSRPHTATDHQA